MTVARAIWIVAPVLVAGVLHVAVITSDLFPRLAVPIDRGRRLWGREIFGANKTWRGFIVMPLATAVTVSLQQSLALASPALAALAPLAPWAPPPFVVGALCGLAYVAAELPNSFVKRRLGIGAGAKSRRFGLAQYLIDQFDSVIGCLVVIAPLYGLSLIDTITAALLGGLAHIAVERAMRMMTRQHAPA